MIALLRLYQLLSPTLKLLSLQVFGFSYACRQREKCSDYTIRMIQTHGTIAGLKMGLIRVARCHG